MKRNLPPEQVQRCRELRKNATNAEILVWKLLRNRQLEGAKFRRQHPQQGFILDFYCHESRLGIELDGSQHLEDDQQLYDLRRIQILERNGTCVLRFWNHDVLRFTEEVLLVILDHLRETETLPSTSPSLPESTQGLRQETGSQIFPLPPGEG